jgi:hypothetical protein
VNLKSFIKSFFSKYADNPINKARLKIWYFTRFTINPKTIFLRKINRRRPGWLLSVYSKTDGKVVFGLTPTWGSLLVGDEMGINDPTISIDNLNDAYYGFNGGLDDGDVLPNDIREWKKIWDKAIKTHQIILSKGNNDIFCPDHEISLYAGLTKEGQICPKCFGLGHVYTYGPQQELGKRLLLGSDIKVIDRRATIKFKPDGLSALLSLSDTYHTGIVAEIAHRYLVGNAFSVIKSTFPDITVFFTYYFESEPGLCDFVRTQNNEIVYRRFFMLQGDHYINLYTGDEETPTQELIPVTSQDNFPDEFRWNVTLDIFRNLCKFAK